MSCAPEARPGAGAAACVWVDAVTVGMVVLGGTIDVAEAARQARGIRRGVTVLDETA